jgi:hypothetical protein
VIVEALRHQLQGERILLAARLLDFGPFVLEPNFDLGFVEAQFGRKLLPSPFREVSVFSKLVLNPQNNVTKKFLK